MADDTEKLILAISADTAQLRRALQRMETDTNRSTRVVERQFQEMGRNVERQVRDTTSRLRTSLADIGKGFGGGLLAGAAAGFSLQAAQRLLDDATKIRNALKTAGLEGEQLNAVYAKLFASAQRNAVPIESLVDLYGKLALTQKELGVSSDDLIKFTDNVALALRAGGTDAQAASGALLQLSQALGGGTVRAEEFNSVLEGAPTIVQAVAAGLEEAGGSVAKLRQLVVDGKVSSRAFFRAFEAGAGTLEAKVKNSEMTISQAFVRLQNVLIDVASKFDETTGASGKLANALSTTLANAIQEIGGLASGTASGPLASFVGGVNAITDAIVGLGAEVGRISGLDQIGAALGATPYRSETLASTPEQLRNRIGELEQQMGGLANAAKPFRDALQAQIDKLKEELLLIEQIGENQRLLNTSRAFGGAAAGASGGGAVPGVKPISLSDYPVGAGGSVAASADRTADSFDRLNEAVTRYVNNVVKAESGGRANAKNPLSSATGLGQFIESTWVDQFQKAFPDRAASMSRETILALRADAEISRALIENYARENAGILRQAGISVNEAALHLAHFLGPQGAVAVLTAKAGTPVSQVLGQDAINANPTILGGGATVDDVIAYGQRRANAVDAINAQRAAVTGLGDAWDGLRERTGAATQSVEVATQQYDVLGQVATTALNGIATALADGKIEGKEVLQIITQIVQQLLTMPKTGGGLFGGAPASGGGNFLGSILGGIGSIFGFANGGIAQNGRPVSTLGIASPTPISIFGETATAEAAVPLTGGRKIPVNMNIDSLSNPLPARRNGSSDLTGIDIKVGVSADSAGNLTPFVESVSARTARQVTKAGIGQYDRQLDKAIWGKMANAQYRQG